jgi:hypothetical protein
LVAQPTGAARARRSFYLADIDPATDCIDLGKCVSCLGLPAPKNYFTGLIPSISPAWL